MKEIIRRSWDYWLRAVDRRGRTGCYIATLLMIFDAVYPGGMLNAGVPGAVYVLYLAGILWAWIYALVSVIRYGRK